jgi:tetratricopeptide (TPR) repeat protein
MDRRLYPKARFPDGHINLADSLNNMANVLLYRGEYARAEAFNREALAMLRRLYAKEKSPEMTGALAVSLGDLGLTLRLQGRYAEAVTLSRECLARIIHGANNC